MNTTANTDTLHALAEIASLRPESCPPLPAYRVAVRDASAPPAPWHAPIVDPFACFPALGLSKEGGV